MVQEALLAEFGVILPTAHSGHGIRTLRKKAGLVLEDLKLCTLKSTLRERKNRTKTPIRHELHIRTLSHDLVLHSATPGIFIM
jgi:hypothetical protein